MNGQWRLALPLTRGCPMSSQEAFLARVRRALHKESLPAAARPPLLWSDQDTAVATADLQTHLAAQRPTLVAQLQQELNAVGGVVAHVHSAAEAVAYVTRLAQEKDATLVVRWQSDLLDTLEVDAALQQQGVTVHATTLPTEALPGETPSAAAMAVRRQELRDMLARADLGLSGVDYVIAETGTLVLTAQAGQMRGVSLLPPVHVAVARTSQVIATLADYLLLVQQAGADVQQALSSCVSFVTGPSRTGDIELKLTVGVHGPGELHLVLLDEPTPG
jgi:L-lactate utilization protein LutC